MRSPAISKPAFVTTYVERFVVNGYAEWICSGAEIFSSVFKKVKPSFLREGIEAGRVHPVGETRRSSVSTALDGNGLSRV
jgi:hypothetical protein